MPALLDAHCHPAEEVRGAGAEAVDAWVRAAGDVPLQQVWAMSTDVHDQPLVARLADAWPDKVVPCFGFHPWVAHTISLGDVQDARSHYAALFGSDDDVFSQFPPPLPLCEAIARLEAYLVAYPQALVGEVGVDRSFRIREPGRGLTRWQTPLEHQIAVLDAQVQLACRYQRSVSMHSVRAAGVTVAWLERMKASVAGFGEINIDLHSCTLSPETIRLVQQGHPNIFVSFSTAVNLRAGRERLCEQIRACDPERLLCESDWHAWDELASRTNDMAQCVVEVHGHDMPERMLRCSYAFTKRRYVSHYDMRTHYRV